MRRLVNSTYISLDGVIESPQNWPSLGSGDDAGNQIQTDLLLASDALLMGRRTYEVFASVWPTRSGDPASDHVNAMPKFVVSSTLQDPGWANTSVIRADPVAEVERMKAEPGQDIVQYGFGPLAHAFLARGLIDELRLWVHPFFVGHGGPDDLLYRNTPTTVLDLVEARPLPSGIVVLTYRGPQ